MKKLLLILLVLSLGLAVAGASAEMEVPDEASFRELVHTMWETNRFESVISRHQSMTIFWEFGDQYNWCYVTADGTYREWNSGEADYIRPDRFGCSAYKDQEGKTIPHYFFDANPDYEWFLQIVMSTEEETWNFEHDTITKVETRDGLVHIHSMYDEELSRQFFEGWGLDAVPGAAVLSEWVINPETNEIIDAFNYMESDGEAVILAHVWAKFDEPEPMACRILRGFLAQETPNMRTVRYIVQPGTDEEATYEIRIPVNHSCTIYDTSGRPFALFGDADATFVPKWDIMSDATNYVFLNADEAMLELEEQLSHQAE